MPFSRRDASRAVAGEARSRAAALFDMGRYAEAETLLREAIRQGSQDALDVALLSACLRVQGRVEEAIEAARAAVALGPDEARTLTALARALLAGGRDREALAAARQAVGLAPGSVDAIAAVAETAMDVSLPEAEAAAIALQRVSPNSAFGHHLRARVEMVRCRWPEAERWLRESLRCNPHSAADHANLAQALEKQGRHDEADLEHREAVRLDPQRETPRQNLHIALRVAERRGTSDGQPYSAATVASTLSPTVRARSLTNVIHDALRHGRIDTARSTADEARAIIDALPLGTVEERRTRILVVDAIAMVEARRGDPVAVCAVLSPLEEEAREILRPRELHVFLNNLGIARMRTGDPAAVATLGSVAGLAREAGNPEVLGRALLNLGAAYAELDDDAHAAACYAECLDLARANGHLQRAGTASLNLARVHLRAERLDEAATHIAEGRRIFATVDLPMLCAQLETVTGWLALRRGDVEGARRALLAGLWALRRGGDRRAVDGFANLAEVEAARGRPAVAALHLRTAERRVRTPANRVIAARARAAVEEASRRRG
jgi:tetratricopeptide (TPR) repeat protein